MGVIEVLRIIATVLRWALMPFQWWSIYLCHKSNKRNKQTYDELNDLIVTYKRKIAELEEFRKHTETPSENP
jgi:hypothetical protein